jgi:hypothetical protein
VVSVVVRRQNPAGYNRSVWLRSCGCWTPSVTGALEFENAKAAEDFLVECGTSVDFCHFEPAPRSYGAHGEGEVSAESQRAIDAIVTAAYEYLREGSV